VVIMEAFSVCRPVIATNIAALAELVEPGRSGWLVEPGDVQGLTKSMEEVLDSSPERLLEMGARGSSRVKAQHDVAQEVTRLLSLIEGASVEHLDGALRSRKKSERERSAASVTAL